METTPATLPQNCPLTTAEFLRLSGVPPEAEWFANITKANTRRAYQNANQDFMRFTGITNPEEFRTATLTHAIAWCDDLGKRMVNGATIRHRLSALSSLFD